MLTDTQIKKAKPAEKAYKLFDSGGLFLYISTAGGKLWRLKYRFNDKEKLLSIGPYPEKSLSDARVARDEAKKHLEQGRDPAVVKKIEALVGRKQSDDTFEVVARAWHALQKPMWSERHAKDVLDSLVEDVFPTLGSLPLRQITPPLVLATVRLIEARGAKETARRVRQRISGVFVYAIASGLADTDPAAVIADAMAPLIKGRFPAIIDLEAAIQMLRDVEKTPAHPVTKLAIRLLALTAARPGPFATTPWAELDDVDPDEKLWTMPAARMKLKKRHKDDERRDHYIPLSSQATETIEVLRSLTGRQPFVFPNSRHAHKPMSENSMGYLLHRAGYHAKHVPHGFRSTFSTIMNELFTADREVIDFMLAHVPKDKTEAAYNRALYINRRKELAQEWADLILPVGSPSAEELLHGPKKILNPENYRKRPIAA